MMYFEDFMYFQWWSELSEIQSHSVETEPDKWKTIFERFDALFYELLFGKAVEDLNIFRIAD